MFLIQKKKVIEDETEFCDEDVLKEMLNGKVNGFQQDKKIGFLNNLIIRYKYLL